MPAFSTETCSRYTKPPKRVMVRSSLLASTTMSLSSAWSGMGTGFVCSPKTRTSSLSRSICAASRYSSKVLASASSAPATPSTSRCGSTSRRPPRSLTHNNTVEVAMSNHALNDLLQQPGIWRAGDPAVRTGLEYVNTGYRVLDQALPGHGWPLGALTEILHDHAGIGELRLLMPALARLSRSGRWIVLVAPPHIPYAPALAASGIVLSRLLLVHPRETGEHDHLWAIEQALRAGTCAEIGRASCRERGGVTAASERSR